MQVLPESRNRDSNPRPAAYKTQAAIENILLIGDLPSSMCSPTSAPTSPGAALRSLPIAPARTSDPPTRKTRVRTSRALATFEGGSTLVQSRGARVRGQGTALRWHVGAVERCLGLPAEGVAASRIGWPHSGLANVSSFDEFREAIARGPLAPADEGRDLARGFGPVSQGGKD